MVRLLKDREISEIFGGVSPMTLWRMRKRRQLPKPHKLNGHNVTPENLVAEAYERLFAANGTHGDAE